MIRNHNLAQAIQDVGWGQFIEILSYKASWHSKNVLKVDRFFASSKTCSCCGHKLKHLPLSERYWTCPLCNAFHDRDVNASINIRNYFVGPVNTEHESLKNIKVDLGGALNPLSKHNRVWRKRQTRTQDARLGVNLSASAKAQSLCKLKLVSNLSET